MSSQIERQRHGKDLVKGVQVINQIEVTKFEQLLNRIIMKMNIHDSEIFTNEEIKKLEKIFKIDEENLLLCIKILLYLLKKSLKLIFMPANLKADLKSIGMESDKCEIFVKLWSSETRSLLNELGSETTERQRHNFDIIWKVNAELSSEYHKKCKIPKAYFSFSRNKDETDIELTHQELYSIFLQFESIQNELDNLV